MRTVKTIRVGDVIYPDCTVTSVADDMLSCVVTTTRKTYYVKGSPTETTDTFTLRREPDEAWKLQSRRELWADVPEFRAWKMPDLHPAPPKARRVAYKPRSDSPGQEVTYVDDDSRMVTGVIWSDGPAPNSLWVVRECSPVLVRWNGGGRWIRDTGADYWRIRLRLAERIRQCTVYPVVEETRKHRRGDFRGFGEDVWRHTLIWHTGDCPEASGRKPYHGDGSDCESGWYRAGSSGTWTPEGIARVIMGLERPNRSPGPFCATCIYQDPGSACIHSPAHV